MKEDEVGYAVGFNSQNYFTRSFNYPLNKWNNPFDDHIEHWHQYNFTFFKGNL